MRHLALFASFAAAALCAVTAASAADPTASLPAGWSHAEINVTGPQGRTHTQIFDRGRVLSNSGSSLTLKEQDGSIVTIQVAPRAVVTINGRRAPLARVAVGFKATTRGTDGRPAQLVRATRPLRRAVNQTA